MFNDKLEYNLLSNQYYYLMFILLEFILLHVFIATNILVFYFYFECVLIPMFLLIGQWGFLSNFNHYFLTQLFFWIIVQDRQFALNEAPQVELKCSKIR